MRTETVKGAARGDLACLLVCIALAAACDREWRATSSAPAVPSAALAVIPGGMDSDPSEDLDAVRVVLTVHGIFVDPGVPLPEEDREALQEPVVRLGSLSVAELDRRSDPFRPLQQTLAWLDRRDERAFRPVVLRADASVPFALVNRAARAASIGRRLGFEVRAGQQDAVLWHRVRTGCFLNEPDHPVEVAPDIWLSSAGWTASSSFTPPRRTAALPLLDGGAPDGPRTPAELQRFVWEAVEALEFVGKELRLHPPSPEPSRYCSSFAEFDQQHLEQALVDIGALGVPAASRRLAATPELPWGRVAPALGALLAGNDDYVYLSERSPDVELARCRGATNGPVPHAAPRGVHLRDVLVRGDVPEAREDAATVLSALRACATHYPDARGPFTLTFHAPTRGVTGEAGHPLQDTFASCAEHVFECRHVFHWQNHDGDVTVTLTID